MLVIIKSDLYVVHHDVDYRFKNAVPQVILLQWEFLKLSLDSLELSVALFDELNHADSFEVLPLLLLQGGLLDVFKLLLEHLDQLLDVFVVQLHVLICDVALTLVDDHLVLEEGLLKGFKLLLDFAALFSHAVKLLLLRISLLVNVGLECVVSVPELVGPLVVISLHVVLFLLKLLQLDVEGLDLFVQLGYLLFELVLVQLSLLRLTHSIMH